VTEQGGAGRGSDRAGQGRAGQGRAVSRTIGGRADYISIQIPLLPLHQSVKYGNRIKYGNEIRK
jgi:hypothetical protein